MPRYGKNASTTRSNEASSVAIGDQAQIAERILDFRALEKPQAAVDLVGQVRLGSTLPRTRASSRWSGTGLRTRAAGRLARQPLLDAAEHEIRLVALVVCAVDPHRLTTRATGPQNSLPRRVELLAISGVCGGLEYRRARAIVLLELIELRLRKVAAEFLQVLDLLRRASDRSSYG